MILRLVRRHPLWTVFVLALVVRVAFFSIARLDPYNLVDSGEYDDIARKLLAGQGYTTGLRANFLRPPAYPVFVAASYAIGGMAVLQAAQILLSSLTAVLVACVAGRLCPAPGTVLVAGLMAAVYPWTFAYIGGLASETLFIFLWVAALLLLIDAMRGPGPARSAFAGLLFGLAGLARTNVLVLGPGLAAWSWWRTGTPLRGAIFGVAAVVALLPFAAYNLASGNGFVLSSNGGGESFYIGNNPGETALYAGRIPDAEKHDASFLGPMAQEYIACPGLRCVDEMPMARRDGFFYAAGLRYITTHPLEALTTDVRKLFHYWRPWVDPDAYPPAVVAVTGISFTVLVAFAIAGVVGMRREDAVLVLIVAAMATLTVVLWHVQLRYRFALLDPVLIAAASGPVAYLLRRPGAPAVARALVTARSTP